MSVLILTGNQENVEIQFVDYIYHALDPVSVSFSSVCQLERSASKSCIEFMFTMFSCIEF